MPYIEESLQRLMALAKKDPDLARKILATRDEKNPVSAFCRLATENDCPLYEMDLIDAGEQYYANMRRSTNGGGENSPLLRGEDDYYEMFLAALKESGQR